jgi:hypothetical protein
MMKLCPGCQTELSQDASACEACGMRFDQQELQIDWNAIERTKARQSRPIAQKLMPALMWGASLAMLFWLATPYVAVSEYIFKNEPVIDLRQHLAKHHAFPKDGSYVSAKELTLGYKGAEWKRGRRFAMGRDEMVYIQVIGAVCPYEMPREDCPRVVVEIPRKSVDFDNFKPASSVNVEGRLLRVTQTSEFAPLIPFLAREMLLDLDGAYIIAHGLRPNIDRDFWIFWGGILLIALVLTALMWRATRN